MTKRGRPPTTTTRILNHLTTTEWKQLPWPHTNRDIASAIYRLKKKGLIQTRPKWDRPTQHAQYKLTPP